MSSQPDPTGRPAGRRFALATLGATLVAFLASSSTPTPLYHLYQQAWGFSSSMLTVVFGTYALALLASLLVVGSLSDHVGRRPVICASVLLLAVAMVLFLLADSVAWLIAARAVQGVAMGAASGAIGAALIDADRTAGQLINSLVPLAGMAVGVLCSSALVSFAPAPMHLGYAILLVTLLLQAGLVWLLPETATRRPGVFASLTPRVHVPAQARGALALITPGNVAGWALAGFYLSLMPSLVTAATGNRSVMVAGAVVGTLTVCGSIAILARRTRTAASNLRLGPPLMILGMAVVLAGTHAGVVALLFAGTAIAGLGLGTNFLGSVNTVMPLAAPDERAGLLSAFYVESYLAFALPAIGAGFLARVIGLAPTADIYAGLVILLTLAGIAAMRLSGRTGARA
ncbi:MFS transporter [Ensifer soli]|uniref:MFS transporter n=1 Tax=Ciceribacter sp. sgz301302 TaxID=3342379 RepID=UPI0035B82281